MRTLVTLLACCLAGAVPAVAVAAPGPMAPPLLQSWSDPAAIASDDDWSGVPALVGHRGDGLTDVPGVDPRTVIADGSGSPVDVNANRTDPTAVGLAAGVTEFELANPVVAIQGSATAGAPHLVLALDTRGRREVSVRLVLRDIDASGANAVSPVAVQYRIGASGPFANAAGGYVADATAGPNAATLSTPLRTTLPGAANDKPLVQVRVITTNAAGQDEWVGVDDVEVTARDATPGACPPPAPGAPPAAPSASPPADVPAGPPTDAPASPPPAPRPRPDTPAAELTGLTLSPAQFVPARRGAALIRRGGTSLRFRLSKPALVRFTVLDSANRELGRFAARGRRGLNRLRFSGRLRGHRLADGAYSLRAVAHDRAGRASQPAVVRFQIGGD